MAVGSRARVANPSGAAAARRGCGKGRLGAVSGLPRGARSKEPPVQRHGLGARMLPCPAIRSRVSVCQWEPRAVRASGSRGPRAFGGLRGQPWRRRRAAPHSAWPRSGADEERWHRMTIHAAGADFPLWKLNLASLRFRMRMRIWHRNSANAETTMPTTWFRLFNFLREGQSQ